MNAVSVELRLASTSQFDAFEPWHASLSSQFFDASLIGENARRRFHGSVTGFHLGEGLIFRSASVAHHLRRDSALVRRSGIDHILIEHQTVGRRSGEFGGHNVDIRPGDVSIIDLGRPVVARDRDFARTSLIVPRDQLPRHIRDRDLHGLVFNEARRETQMLAALLERMMQRSAQADSSDMDSSMQAVFTLVDAAAGSAQTRLAEALRGAGPVLFQIAQGYIDARLTSRTLTAETVANAMNLSRATLYRLFENHGGVRTYITARRLDRCFEIFRRTRGPVSIGEIAFAHGFNSEAHFSRAFRFRFGMTPRDAVQLAGSDAPPEENLLGPLTIMPDWIRQIGRRAA
ncbi:MAG: helix-turn-helix domain-containing protein [Pseudorhodoplanes sp.]|uniref:helix-turn-helix domain-containing protein n=1 Tax=Pseudorhodoplanes sp. TaxID=1934341 RepID=UPI003D0C9A89